MIKIDKKKGSVPLTLLYSLYSWQRLDGRYRFFTFWVLILTYYIIIILLIFQ